MIQLTETEIDLFLGAVGREVRRAIKLFPTNEYQHAALAEEAGEVADAMIEHARGTVSDKHVYGECVQTAAMAVRVALHGDSGFPYLGGNRNAPGPRHISIKKDK